MQLFVFCNFILELLLLLLLTVIITVILITDNYSLKENLFIFSLLFS